MIAAQLGTHTFVLSPRSLVREKTTLPRAHAPTRSAFSLIVRKPYQTIVAGATRLIDAFFASVVSYNRPRATDAPFLWRYISEDDLADLIWCLRVGDKTIRSFHTHQMAEDLEPFPVAPTDPMSPEMWERGKPA